ncbi:MAG: UDP-N-acetylmuramate dehydrogenase [Candidatus Magasanikbacteria bacterium]|nr:UDP-N-acetylmuramate dehydrogenase [Candidatus Magasanikbacteria bacterium]
MNELYQTLKKFGKVKLDEPMSKHTTFKIGGPAKYFVIVDDTDKLVELLKFLDGEGEDYILLGGGSNTLMRDEGYRGVVVKIQNSSRFNRNKIQNSLVEISAGCSTVATAQETIKAGLTGFEWGVGVPGTIGGAVRGNAGIPSGEMKDNLLKCEVYRDGEILELSNAECEFGYRDSIFKHNTDVILRVWLKLEQGTNIDLQKKAFEYIDHRNKTQPKGFTAGCVFKNVPCKTLDAKILEKIPQEYIEKGKIPAGWLVDQVGMKGAEQGKAKVSEVHGNFMMNMGGARAQDVCDLVEKVKEKVYTRYGIELYEEVQII